MKTNILTIFLYVLLTPFVFAQYGVGYQPYFANNHTPKSNNLRIGYGLLYYNQMKYRADGSDLKSVSMDKNRSLEILSEVDDGIRLWRFGGEYKQANVSGGNSTTKHYILNNEILLKGGLVFRGDVNSGFNFVVKLFYGVGDSEYYFEKPQEGRRSVTGSDVLRFDTASFSIEGQNYEPRGIEFSFEGNGSLLFWETGLTIYENDIEIQFVNDEKESISNSMGAYFKIGVML